MVKNLIFDMGQVLIHWTPDLYLSHYDLKEEDRQLLKAELFGGVEWVQLDRGSISEEDATDAVCARIPRRLHNIAEELITEWWRQPMRPVDGMAELIAQLKWKGYGIYLLSNAGLPLRNYFRWIPSASYFDGLMVSSEEKMVKPHYEIYYALFERFDLKPEECFFIDDSPLNVEAAACCGMAGTVFKGDITRLKRELLDAGLWLM